VNGFYWLIPGVLAGTSRPGGRPGTDPTGAQLAADLAWLRGQGIRALLTLTEDPLDAACPELHGLAVLHLPVIDFTPPSPEQLGEALAFIDRQRALDAPVAVHCLAGQGRTGCVLAAYLIRGGIPPDRAIAELRLVCPHGVENPRQEQALADYAARRDWLA
jgi:atypical dual specificity phosphatase